MITNPTQELGLHIAYSGARSDIECFVPAVCLDPSPSSLDRVRHALYDLSAPIIDTFERESVAMAVQWLEAHDLLLRHPSRPHLVNVAPAPAGWAEQAAQAVASYRTPQPA